MANRTSKKGTILLLIASIGFLVASIWLMQVHIKPKNTGNTEFDIVNLGNEGENYLYYIDRAAELSLQKALDVKSREYKTQEKTYTNREVCNIQLDACKEGKPDCETNLKLFCKDEMLKAFKENFDKYIKTFNEETGKQLDIRDYQFEIKTTTTKTREIEITGKTNKALEEKKEGIEYSIKPNFRVKVKI